MNYSLSFGDIIKAASNKGDKALWFWGDHSDMGPALTAFERDVIGYAESLSELCNLGIPFGGGYTHYELHPHGRSTDD